MFLFVLMSDFLCYNFFDPKSTEKICLASYVPLTFSEATKSYINKSTQTPRQTNPTVTQLLLFSFTLTLCKCTTTYIHTLTTSYLPANQNYKTWN